VLRDQRILQVFSQTTDLLFVLLFVFSCKSRTLIKNNQNKINICWCENLHLYNRIPKKRITSLSFVGSPMFSYIMYSDIIKYMNLHNTKVSNAYFIDGPGGKGKTYVYKCLINKCIEMGCDVISVAWIGIAAMLLPGGHTVHIRFKLNFILTDDSVLSLKVNRKEISTKTKFFLLWTKHLW
jgi:hypothetical protein